VLLQKGADGKWMPVSCVSRRCEPAEAEAEATEGELIALSWGVKRFEKFLMYDEFEAFVDHEALAWLKKKELGSVRNKRWQNAFAYLRQFKFNLNFRPGSWMK